MAVKIRQYVRDITHVEGCKKRKCGPECMRVLDGWEVDLVLQLPNGEVIRERTKSPVPSKSGSKFWAEQRATELLKGLVLKKEPDVPTFGDFFERYIEGQAVANREKPSSIDGKRRVFKNYLKDRFSKTRLNELSAEDVQRLKGQLADLKPKTVNNALSLLNGMLKTAQEWGVIRELPVRIRMLKLKVEEVPFYEPDQFERLVEMAGKIDRQVLATVLLGGDAGLRTGEMLGLKWSDIDFTKGELHIRRAVWMGHVTLPKSGKARTVPMTKRLAESLKAMRHLVREEVLYRPEGQAATRSTLNKWLMQAERRANLEAKGALHMLRHTFCSRLARNGAPAAAISKLAGHSSFSTTARYIHLFSGEKENAIRLLDGGSSGDILETGRSPAPEHEA